MSSFTRALADDDRIYAVIRGSAVNHDGYKASLIAPNPLQHEAVIRAACRDARIDPAMVRASSSRGASRTTQREPRVLHHWLV